MSERRRYLFPLVAVLIIVALGWWITREPGSERRLPEIAGPEEPAYFMNDALLRTYTVDGHLEGEMEADRVDYYEDADRWSLQQPRWTRYPIKNEKRLWRGHARTGTLTEDETHARLEGDVVLNAHGGRGPVTVRTDRLLIDLPRDFAHTPLPVDIKAPNWRMSGRGGEFWMAEERMRLLADVEGVYDPRP